MLAHIKQEWDFAANRTNALHLVDDTFSSGMRKSIIILRYSNHVAAGNVTKLGLV